MNILKHWKVILAVILVFAAGGVIGSVGTIVYLKHHFARGFSVESKTAREMEELQKELNLTPEQQPKIKAILLDNGHKFESSFGQAMRESGTNTVESWKLIEKELTPEQRVIFQRICQKHREGMKNTLKIDLPPQ
jgi:Spy/CpxP family protein refolding chaperone